MTNKKIKINEMVAEMDACREGTYKKEEKLSELLKLQNQLVDVTFGKGASDDNTLKLWDVWNRLWELNENAENRQDELFTKVKNQCKDICNSIKGEISGNRGERLAFNAIDKIGVEHRILKNLKFKEGQAGAELDAVVLTRKGIAIVEVKNTRRDIMIAENGAYYRMGDYLKFDQNIGSKMNYREQLIKETLYGYGLSIDDIPVLKLVVFTDNRIEVTNKCNDIKTTFLAPMPYIIEKFGNDEIFNFDELDSVAELLEQARCANEIPWDIDLEQFKIDFATLLVNLTTQDEDIYENETTQTGLVVDIWKKIFSTKAMKTISRVAACMVSSVFF